MKRTPRNPDDPRRLLEPGNRAARRPPPRDMTAEERQRLAGAIAVEWIWRAVNAPRAITDPAPELARIAERGWKPLAERSTEELWRLWREAFGAYPAA